MKQINAVYEKMITAMTINMQQSNDGGSAGKPVCRKTPSKRIKPHPKPPRLPAASITTKEPNPTPTMAGGNNRSENVAPAKDDKPYVYRPDGNACIERLKRRAHTFQSGCMRVFTAPTVTWRPRMRCNSSISRNSTKRIPPRVGTWYEKGVTLRGASSSLISTIDSLKTAIARQADGPRRECRRDSEP